MKGADSALKRKGTKELPGEKTAEDACSLRAGP